MGTWGERNGVLRVTSPTSDDSDERWRSKPQISGEGPSEDLREVSKGGKARRTASEVALGSGRHSAARISPLNELKVTATRKC